MIYEVSQMTKEIIHYSEDELKKLSSIDLIQIIENIREEHTYQWLSCNLHKINLCVYQELQNRTIFLDRFYCKEKVPMMARLYCIEHNVTELPICQNPNCQNHNLVGWDKRRNRFNRYCCKECCKEDPMFGEKVVQTTIGKFGVRSTLQLDNVKIKAKQTLEQRYGVDNPMKCKEIQEKAKTRIISCMEEIHLLVHRKSKINTKTLWLLVMALNIHCNLM